MTIALKMSRLQRKCERERAEVVVSAKGVEVMIVTNASFVWTSQEMEEQTPRDRNVWSKNAQDPLLTNLLRYEKTMMEQKIKTHDELLGGN